MKTKRQSISEQLYMMLLVFIFLEDQKTTKELVIELKDHGIERDIRTVQRTLILLEKSGFPIERKQIKGQGNEYFYKWKDSKNTLDYLIQAKASAFLERVAA